MKFFSIHLFCLTLIAVLLCAANLSARDALPGISAVNSQTTPDSLPSCGDCGDAAEDVNIECSQNNLIRRPGEPAASTSRADDAKEAPEENIAENKIAPFPAAEPVIADTAEVLAVDDNSIYIPWSEYTIAGTRRYTIDNLQPMRITKINALGAAAVGAAYFGILAGLHIYQANTIWDSTTHFRIIEDIDQDYLADKGGHFFGAYFTSYCSTEVLIGAGFSYELAAIVGGIMGLAYQTYIEVMDGFGTNWGFSPSDFYADVAGYAFYMAQHYSAFLQNFTPKMTYFPAGWYDEKPRRESKMFIDDYSSWTCWISAKMCNLTPTSWKWPRWLDLSVGYAARDLHYENGAYYGKPRFSIALDYNIVELLPDGGNFFNWLKQTMNYFKFPAPAIEFGEGTRFRLLYPFVLSFGAKFKF